VAELRVRLGHGYAARSWWKESLEAYRAAVRLEPAYRADPALIENTIRGLVSPSHGGRAARFLRDEIGAPAIPFLEKARRSKSLNTQRHAERLLRQLAPAR
jgi:hypothetical protein